MSRPVRLELPLADDHVMNRGLAYQAVCTDHADRERFLELLGECHEMWGVQGSQGNLSRVMRHLDGLYTQSLKKEARLLGDIRRSKHFSQHEPRADVTL